MQEYYKQLEALSSKANGPYRLSAILIKRVRQLVKGSLGTFRSEAFDPVRTAFEEYANDSLSIAEEGPSLFDTAQTGKKKK